MKSLAVKYRPQIFAEVSGQNITTRILTKVLEKQNYKNAYLFSGPSGCGKTTLARIFAKAINGGVGEPVELDAASGAGGVEQVRAIIESANQRSLTGTYKTYIIDECVTGDTEILTDSGWKRFDSLNKTEKIAQYNSGKIEFVTPSEYVELEYSGEMYNVAIGNKACFTMSPNHVQPLYYVKSGKVKESYVKDAKFTTTNKFIRSGEGVGIKTSLSYLDKLAIALQADGGLHSTHSDYNYWTIQVKKQNKKDNLKTILENSGLVYREVATNRPGCIRYSVKTPLSITKKLSTHFNLTDMNATYAKEFIQELMNWDGCISKLGNGKYLYYSCVDKENVDFCQCVGILGGYKSRTSIQVDNRKENHRDAHRLYLEEAFYGTPNQSIRKEVIDFTGKIYCVKVPSHQIIIRKDGFELVTGNCHAITSAGWQAFLKGIEETPEYTIFIFCTTEPNKIPATIQNRMQRFNIAKISSQEIRDRLIWVCQQEGFNNYENTCELISKLCDGCMREALTMLDQCADLSNDLSLENTKAVLGDSPFERMLKITNFLIRGNTTAVLGAIEVLTAEGKDLKQFVNEYLSFILELTKYSLFGSMAATNIPVYLENTSDPMISVSATCASMNNIVNWFNYLTTKLLEVKNAIKYDTSVKAVIEAYLMQVSLGK